MTIRFHDEDIHTDGAGGIARKDLPHTRRSPRAQKADPSPEAVAAFPNHIGGCHQYIVNMQRAAFDKGSEYRMVAGREALIDLLKNHFVAGTGRTLSPSQAVAMAEAILASDIIRDEREVKAEALDEEAHRRGVSSLVHDTTEARTLGDRANEIRAGRS